MPIGIKVLFLNMEVAKIRVYLRCGVMFQTICSHFNFSDDAVPVGLGVFGIGMATCIQLLRHTATIIDHDGQFVLAGGEYRR